MAMPTALTDGRGKTVTEVVCETDHGEERWTGDIVALAAGAVNTAVILQASANAAWPKTYQHPKPTSQKRRLKICLGTPGL